MYESGDWSDLKIHTPTHTFNVHKSVVCPRCPFLHAACTRDWKEAQTGIIELPESEDAIDVLLLYLYGQVKSGDDPWPNNIHIESIKMANNVLIAADKVSAGSQIVFSVLTST